MSDICYPDTTDWSCRFTPAELTAEKSTPEGLALIERSEAFGWSLLASLTAYRIGVCPTVLRPCAARCAPEGSYRQAVVGRASMGALPALTIGTWSPYISGGVWYNACGCRGADSCSCARLSEVILPGPVGSIVQVRLDAETILEKTAYRVFNGNRLVRLDGEAWPACQDMTAPDTHSFTVTYYRGARPNALVNAAAGALASEFYASCKDEGCRLPATVTSMTRLGESYDLSGAGAEDGFSIPEVEAVIRIYNPFGVKMDAVVASPDTIDAGGMMPTWN